MLNASDKVRENQGQRKYPLPVGDRILINMTGHYLLLLALKANKLYLTGVKDNMNYRAGSISLKNFQFQRHWNNFEADDW